MTMTAQEMTAPPVEKLRSTLLDVAHVEEGVARFETTDVFESWRQLKFGGYAFTCDVNNKDFDQARDWVDAFRFTAYGGLVCKSIGNGTLRISEGGVSAPEQEAGALEAFTLGESIAVERALMAYRFLENTAGGSDEASGGTDDLPGQWDGAIDISDGGSFPTVVAVGLLEEKMADLYVGLPVIHMPKASVEHLLQLGGAEFEGDIIRTKQGSKIVAGGGYMFPHLSPDGDEIAQAGPERWLYATGEIAIRRGSVLTRSAFDSTTNEVFTLVERPYVVAVDGPVVAVDSILY